jgi:cytochrome c-type biogenesis protein
VDLGAWVQQAMGGSMLLAVPIALLAGVVSFISPCVVPLIPGYLSFATGLGASQIAEGRVSPTMTARMVGGSALFVAGFTAVFLATGVVVGAAGQALLAHQRAVGIVVGVVTIALGLMFAGLFGFGGRTVRLDVTPRAGLATAPLLGVVFGLGWTPCIGPALSVVLSLALNEGSMLRGAVLALCYSLGLGVPFVLAGLSFAKLADRLAWVKKHARGLQVASGLMMVGVGVLLVTGVWDWAMSWLRQWISAYGTVI